MNTGNKTALGLGLSALGFGALMLLRHKQPSSSAAAPALPSGDVQMLLFDGHRYEITIRALSPALHNISNSDVELMFTRAGRWRDVVATGAETQRVIRATYVGVPGQPGKVSAQSLGLDPQQIAIREIDTEKPA